MKKSSVFVEKVLFRMNNIIEIPMTTCNNYIEEHIKKSEKNQLKFLRKSGQLSTTLD